MTRAVDLPELETLQDSDVFRVTRPEVPGSVGGKEYKVQKSTVVPDTSAQAATDDVTVANTTTETSIVDSSVGNTEIAANSLEAGQQIHLYASGIVGTTGAPDLTIRIKLGSITSSVTETMATVTDDGWEIEAIWTCRVTGASGSVIGHGWWQHHDATGSGSYIPFIATSASAIDWTTAQTIDVTVQWSTADPADTFTCQQFYIEVV